MHVRGKQNRRKQKLCRNNILCECVIMPIANEPLIVLNMRTNHENDSNNETSHRNQICVT